MSDILVANLSFQRRWEVEPGSQIVLVVVIRFALLGDRVVKVLDGGSKG